MEVTSVSLKGHRNQNEDEHNVITDRNNINFLSVYDGHGGKFVSKYLHDNLYKFFINNRVNFPIEKKYIYDVFDYVQKNLKDKHSIESLHTGSTCCMAIEYKKDKDSYLTVANVGDSRCILCRNNIAIPLTLDHKPNWPNEENRIRQLGGSIEFDGDDWRVKDLSVSRSFGDFDATPFLTHRPDIYKYKLDKSDKFVVLACDGLWDVMDSQSVVNFVLSTCYDQEGGKRPGKNINISKRLADHAIKKGSMDNVSVIVAFFNKEESRVNEMKL
jgi:serine/threonine protein phosphatase PrpC